MNSYFLLAYASLAASRTFLRRLLACLNFTLESEDSSVWYKQKQWFLWTVAAVQAPENHGDEWGLTSYFLWDIYIYINSNLNPLTSSSRRTKLKDILPWNMSQMIMKTIPIGSQRVISYVMKQGIVLRIWWKVNGNWFSKHLSIIISCTTYYHKGMLYIYLAIT